MVEGISHFTTHSMLGMSKGTILARYSNILMAFLLSGLIHIGSDYGAGVPVHESGAVQFFSTQALGILLEDGLQATYYSLTGKPRPSKAPTLHRLVGYTWLVLFLAWSTPVWSFPQIRHLRSGVDFILPFNIYKHLVQS